MNPSVVASIDGTERINRKNRYLKLSKITKVKTDNFSSKAKGFNTNLIYKKVYGDNLIGIQFTF